MILSFPNFRELLLSWDSCQTYPHFETCTFTLTFMKGKGFQKFLVTFLLKFPQSNSAIFLFHLVQASGNFCAHTFSIHHPKTLTEYSQVICADTKMIYVYSCCFIFDNSIFWGIFLAWESCQKYPCFATFPLIIVQL